MIETESVLLEFIALFIQWGLLMESSSVYQRILLFKSFLKAINFLQQLKVCSQLLPRVSFRHVR